MRCNRRAGVGRPLRLPPGCARAARPLSIPPVPRMNLTTLRMALMGLCLTVAVAVPARAQCPAAGAPIVVLNGLNASGNITGTQTLVNTNVYVLQNVVEVKSGGELIVPAGTCIFADAGLEPSSLIIRRGGKITAIGTPSSPIIISSANNTELFNVGATYQDAPGAPAANDWGGVTIIGNGVCNGANDTTVGSPDDLIPGDCEVEGIDTRLPGFTLAEADAVDNLGFGRLTWGGSTPADNSGTLQYVRIEYAGFTLTPNNELNLLTLFGVGSGTTIDHVHLKQGSDDGLEIFGGAVDVKFIVVTAAQDDSFDYSYGWTGRAQFVLAQLPGGANPTLANGDRGIEADNNEREAGEAAGNTDFNLTPRTKPVVYNSTFIGNGGTNSQAIQVRRGVAGTVQNTLVSAFALGINVDDNETYALCNNSDTGELWIDNVRFSDGTLVAAVPLLYQTAATDANCAGNAVAQSLTGLTANAANRTAPNFQPLAGFGGATPPTGGFFDTSATYLGAVQAGGTPFYQVGSWVRF